MASRIEAPTEHGDGPITDVHDPGLLRFLSEAYAQMRTEGVVRPAVVAEAFNVRGLTEGMPAPSERRMAISGRTGFWAFDTSTPIVAGSYVAARGAVDVALTTADIVLGGEKAAYGLCRPPGHHAARSMYGGYCFFNNAAIAAEAIVKATGEHVAILDVDYHHGNGTEQIFWRRGTCPYLSIHADPARLYPAYLGWADETGEGPARAPTSTSRCRPERQRAVPGRARSGAREDRRLEGLDRRRVARVRHIRARPIGDLP